MVLKKITLLIQLKSCLLLIDKFLKKVLLQTLSFKKKTSKATVKVIVSDN